MVKDRVQILLSTFNGEAHLAEQIESILCQSYKNWELLIRDDGSTDGTLNILDKYCSNYPIQIIRTDQGEGGSSTKSFITLLGFSDAPYIMFCDQDDIWEKHKIESSFSQLLKVEKSNPVALVFSDMKVVSQNLDVQFESFMTHQKLNPEWASNNYFVYAQSLAAGCTMIFTKSLKEKMKPIADALFQHDHWLLINAAKYGKIAFLNQKTVLYRQHQQNVIGSHKINPTYFYKKIGSINTVFQRWKYLKSQFPETRIFSLFTAKLKLNLYRFFRTF